MNNAGVGGPFHRADEVDEAEWDAVFGVNVDGTRHFCRWAIPRMKEHRFGRIVNIASIQGLFGGTLSSTYVATKHAVIGYSIGDRGRMGHLRHHLQCRLSRRHRHGDAGERSPRVVAR